MKILPYNKDEIERIIRNIFNSLFKESKNRTNSYKLYVFGTKEVENFDKLLIKNGNKKYSTNS